MTLMDRFDFIANKYIRRSKQNEKPTYEDLLNLPEQYEGKPNQQLTPEKCREYALISSLFIKGTIKKNSDTFRAWFKLKREDGIKMPEDEILLIKKFEKRIQIKKKFKLAGMSADIWGDGYLLIKFNENEDGDEKLKRKVEFGIEPLDLILLNPENITEMYYPDGIKGQIYYHYLNVKKNEDFPIHPDRILHIKTLELPNSSFGVSKVQLLRNTLISSEEIDIATGEILKWFSHGIQILSKQGMSKAEREKAVKLMKTHPNFFAFNEKYTFDIKNPTAINPTPFYDHVVEAIAAALIMPKQVLLGVQIGKVTGAEIGFADYYRDIKDNQDLVYTPLIERLYELLGDSYSKSFEKYDVIWETTYIDELAEADILGKRVAAAVNARSSQKPLITVKEARRIINEGTIELNPEDVPAEEIKQIVSPIGDAIKKDIKDKPEERQILPTKRENEKDDNWKQNMIDDYKIIQELAKKEKELGKKILKEQEENKDGNS